MSVEAMPLFKYHLKNQKYSLLRSLEWAILNCTEPNDCMLEPDVVTFILRVVHNHETNLFCIGGGYVSYLLGKTNKFTDVDIFLFNSPISCAFSSKYIYKGVELNFISLNITDVPSNLELLTYALISNFDISICMSALIYKNNRWFTISLHNDGMINCFDKNTENRILKYKDRLFSDTKLTPKTLSQLCSNVICKGFREASCALLCYNCPPSASHLI